MKFPTIAFSVLFLTASSITLEKRQTFASAGPFGTLAQAGGTVASTGGGPGFFARPWGRWI